MDQAIKEFAYGSHDWLGTM